MPRNLLTRLEGFPYSSYSAACDGSSPSHTSRPVNGSCRYVSGSMDILPHISADAVATDPVWPNCPDGLLVGADRPGELLIRWKDKA